MDTIGWGKIRSQRQLLNVTKAVIKMQLLIINKVSFCYTINVNTALPGNFQCCALDYREWYPK